MSIDKLNRVLERDISRRKTGKMDDAFLTNVSILCREYFQAKSNIIKRFSSNTTKAEQILRMAKHRGILKMCIMRGFLPPQAESLKVDEGAPFRGYYATLEDSTGNRPKLLSGGAFEMDRRRH
jgi:hypothetical protein